jgi:hypothetical protein
VIIVDLKFGTQVQTEDIAVVTMCFLLLAFGTNVGKPEFRETQETFGLIK